MQKLKFTGRGWQRWIRTQGYPLRAHALNQSLMLVILHVIAENGSVPAMSFYKWENQGSGREQVLPRATQKLVAELGLEPRFLPLTLLSVTRSKPQRRPPCTWMGSV